MTEAITSERQLDAELSRPTAGLIECMRRIEGDLVVLGVGGKMGLTLARMAHRASVEAGIARRVIGVSRFSSSATRDELEAAGVETVACDLLERDAVATLPEAANVVFMAGRKFGTQGDEELTWATNALVPAHVAERYAGSRIVAFSTGCVYPFVSPESGGSREDDALAPVGEYAQSCLARERIFEYFSKRNGTPVCLLRLNYAIDLRYGVLHDIARRIVAGEAIDISMGSFNCIWQGDANAQAIQALDYCESPAVPINVTGPEIIAVRDVARDLARALGRDPEAIRLSGDEAPTAWLNDASRAHELFGAPTVGLETMIEWTAAWQLAGGASLGKPTQFEIRDGSY